jgi:prepilin-type N-terminal cleavage/methylation domain-containing protein
MARNDPDGGNCPHAGFTLVELMVSLLIVGIVMLGWWRIMNATSPYREAQRRAAVEVAAGFLDIIPTNVTVTGSARVFYEITLDGGLIDKGSGSVRLRFPDGCLPPESPVRYALSVARVDHESSDWRNWRRTSGDATNKDRIWARVEVYDSEHEAKPFAAFEQLVNIQ